MADDVDWMNLAFERLLESFKLQKLKDSHAARGTAISSERSRCVRYSTNGVSLQGGSKTRPERRPKSSLPKNQTGKNLADEKSHKCNQ